MEIVLVPVTENVKMHVLHALVRALVSVEAIAEVHVEKIVLGCAVRVQVVPEHVMIHVKEPAIIHVIIVVEPNVENRV